MKLIQENNGKDSSFRVAMLAMTVFWAWSMVLYSIIVWHEIKAPPIDWLGLTGFYTAAFGTGSALLWMKTLHKKLEK